MLGLALAIDYSLFLTSRFREELARGRTVEQAVERAVGHGRQGRAVLRHRGRDRALRPALVQGERAVLDRPRRRDRRPRLGLLQPDLPARDPGHARAARERALRRRAPAPARAAPRRPRARSARRAGSRSHSASCGDRSSSSSPVLALLLLRRLAVPPAPAGRAGRDRLPGGRRQPRRVGRAPDRVPGRRDDADRHPARHEGRARRARRRSPPCMAAVRPPRRRGRDRSGRRPVHDHRSRDGRRR